jgi:hypothetical protein
MLLALFISIGILLLPYAAVVIYQHRRDTIFSILTRDYGLVPIKESKQALLFGSTVLVRVVEGSINGSEVTIADCYRRTWLRPRFMGTPPLFLKYFTLPFSFAGAYTMIIVNGHQFRPREKRAKFISFLSKLEIYEVLNDFNKSLG